MTDPTHACPKPVFFLTLWASCQFCPGDGVPDMSRPADLVRPVGHRGPVPFAELMPTSRLQSTAFLEGSTASPLVH